MRALLTLPLIALVAACGTPQEQCIRRETRDLRTLDRLIGVTEANLERGYALVEVPMTFERWETCLGNPVVVANPQGGTTVVQQPYMCRRDYTEFVTRPKAIDLKAEAQKLRSMQEKRVSLVKAANNSVAQCKALHPEKAKS